MKINIKDIINKGFINNSIENGEITKIINFFDVYQLIGLSKFFIEYDKALKNNKNITQIKNNLHDLFTIKSQFDYADKRVFQLIFLNDYIALKEMNGIKVSKDEAISELLNNEKDIENLNQIINVVKDSNFNYLKFIKILFELKKVNSDISDIVKIIITNDKGHVSNKNKGIFSSILKKLSSINIEENESVYLFNIKNNFKSLLSSTNETIINNNSISYYLLINSLIEELINIEFYKLSNKMVTETRLDYINYSNKENINLSIIKDDFNYETKNKIKDIIINEAAFKLVNDILKNGEIKNMDDSLEITNTFRENMEKEYINKIINIEVFYNNNNLKDLIKYLKTILQQTHIKVKLLFSVMATIEFVLTENKYSMLKFEELVNINMFKYDNNRVDNDTYINFINKDENENINDMSTQIDEENINIDNIIHTLSLNSDNDNNEILNNNIEEKVDEKVNLVLDENIFDEENIFNENNISELQNNQTQDNQINNFDIDDDSFATLPIDKNDEEEQQSVDTYHYTEEDNDNDNLLINQNTNISFDDDEETSNINFDNLINNENEETNIKIDFNNEDLINVNHNDDLIIQDNDNDIEVNVPLNDIDNNLSVNNSVIKSIHEFVINQNTSFIDDLESENFGIFESYQEEALELITTIQNTNFYTDDVIVQNQNFKRFFHSLKGNSSMVGLTSIAEIFYWFEIYFEKNTNIKINNNQLNIIDDLFKYFKEFLYEINKDKTSIVPIAKYYKLIKNDFDDNIGFSEFNSETYSQYLVPVDNDLSNTSIRNEISNEKNYETKNNNEVENEENYNNENELDSDDDIFSEEDFDDDELEVNNSINTNKISFKPQEIEEKEDFNEKLINVNNESNKFVDEQIEDEYELNQSVNIDNNHYQERNNYTNDVNVNNHFKKVISINGETVSINGKVFNSANYFQFLNDLNRSIEQLNNYNETNYHNHINNNEEILINIDVLDFFNNITYNLKAFNLNKTAILYNNLTSLIRIYIESNIYFNHSLYSILNVSINNLNNVVNKNMEEEFEFEVDNIKLEIQTIMNVKTSDLNRISMENLNNKVTELVNERFVSIYGEIEKLNEKLATINEYQNNIKLNVKDISNNLNKANLEINLEQLSSNIDTLKNDTEKGMKMLNKNIKTIYNIVKSLLNNKDDGNNSGGFFSGLFKK